MKLSIAISIGPITRHLAFEFVWRKYTYQQPANYVIYQFGPFTYTLIFE